MEILANNFENEKGHIRSDSVENSSSALQLTELPDDILIHLFSILSYRDRAIFSSVCRRLRSVSHSSCLWMSLDLRLHKFDSSTANALSSRCSSLRKLRFQGHESAKEIIKLKARNLVEISGSLCQEVSDTNLSLIAAKHALLESLQLGPELCDGIRGRGIITIGRYCPNLKKFWISGISRVDSDILIPLAKNCHGLTNIAFIDCESINLTAAKELANLVSVRFLSIAGATLNSDSVTENLIKFPNLLALDISRTDIISTDIIKLLSCCPNLKVLCALHCPALDQDINFYHHIRNTTSIQLISMLTDIPALLSSLAVNRTIMSWIEQVLSHSLLRLAESYIPGMEDFWVNQGATLLINWLENSQEDVQERTIKGIAKFIINIDYDEETKYEERTNAMIHGGGIISLLNLAKSSNGGVQLEAVKTIALLCLDNKISSVIVEEEGIQILLNLVNSTSKILFEEAIKALRNLSMWDEHKIIIFECGGLEILISLVYKWTSSNKEVLNHIVTTLQSMTSDEKISMEIINNGGLNALVTLTQECMSWEVLIQAIRVFANLAGIGYTNNNNITVGLEPSLIQRLEQLIRSPLNDVRQEAVVALWNLSSSDARIRELILVVDDIEALNTLPNI